MIIVVYDSTKIEVSHSCGCWWVPVYTMLPDGTKIDLAPKIELCWRHRMQNKFREIQLIVYLWWRSLWH